MAKVALDFVPELAQPPEIGKAIAEAKTLRDKAREASEAVARAQALVDELEREDVEAAAARARAGEPLGAPAAALRKARDQLALEQRAQAATRLAQAQAEADVGETIVANAETWRTTLDAEVERARDDARRLVGELRDALTRVGDGLGTKHWLDAGGDGNFEHRPTGVTTGSFAPSSRRRTANSEPLNAAELFEYVGELIDPPSPTPRPGFGRLALDTSDAA